ncbi:Peroxidase superfamily protein [Perilla frutescens var. frutescens]|nr:Peroxidase superfamily protein [Perilla frutescens var. frutescens]
MCWFNNCGALLIVSILTLGLPLSILSSSSGVSLSPHYYDDICPKALPAIKRIVEDAIAQENRMGASLLRLHFHDCFVQGCDGSVLLDETASMESEKSALPNANSARGFEVIDRIKSHLDKLCENPIVSCADILAVAARDSVVALGGPTWKVRLGRRDSTTANKAEANTSLPSPFSNLPQLIQSFRNQGLNAKDLVVLSGAHTLGFSQCSLFKGRIHNATADDIDATFARRKRVACPRSGGDSNLLTLDQTPSRFDARYFSNLVSKRGLLQSDQALFGGGGGETDELVNKYSQNYGVFWRDFRRSMIRMGKIRPLTGVQGQIRTNCRKAN